MRFKTAFSYYGSKSKIVGRYPAPEHQLIVEPFAGSAAYAFYWSDFCDVWINDLDPVTFSMWQFLQRPDAAKYIEMIPETCERGVNVFESFAHLPPALQQLIRCQCNMGTQGTKQNNKIVTFFGSVNWHRLRPQLLFAASRVQKWKVTNISFDQIPNRRATWFVDPPYNNAAGDKYRTNTLSFDYSSLADWCSTRKGQTIVCENDDADWLPFRSLELFGGHASKKLTISEAIWTNSQ